MTWLGLTSLDMLVKPEGKGKGKGEELWTPREGAGHAGKA